MALNPQVSKLRTYLQSNTDKQGEPLYEAAKAKLLSMMTIEDPSKEEAQAIRQKPVATLPEYLAGTRTGSLASGAADLPLGVLQGITERITNDLRSLKDSFSMNAPTAQETGVSDVRDLPDREVKDNLVTTFLKNRERGIQRGREATGREGLDVPRLGGNIITGMAVTGGAPVLPSVTQKSVQGGVLGAEFGAATPVTEGDFEEEKRGQVTAGAVTGALVPPAAEGLKKGAQFVGGKLLNVGRNVRDVFTDAGTDRALARVISDTTDDTAGLARTLRENASKGTAAQASTPAKNTRFSALARDVQSRRPDQKVLIQEAQNKARRALIQEAGGARAGQSIDDVIEEATRTRASVTNPLFEAARQSDEAVDVSRVKGLVTRFINSDPNNQKLVPVLNQVDETLQAGDAKSLISASQNIGRIMSEKGPNGQLANESIVRQLSTVKKALDNAIGKKVPAWKEANKLFSELSVPVNRAQIAKRLENVLVNPIQGSADDVITQRGAMFARAMQDERKLIQQATGFKRGKSLEKVFGEENMGKLLTVLDEVQNDATLKRLADEGREGLRRILGEAEGQPLPNALHRPIMVLNAIIRRSGLVRTEKGLDRASQIFEDPLLTAQLIEKHATPAEIKALQGFLSQIPANQLIRTAPAIAASGAE